MYYSFKKFTQMLAVYVQPQNNSFQGGTVSYCFVPVHATAVALVIASGEKYLQPTPGGISLTKKSPRGNEADAWAFHVFSRWNDDDRGELKRI